MKPILEDQPHLVFVPHPPRIHHMITTGMLRTIRGCGVVSLWNSLALECAATVSGHRPRDQAVCKSMRPVHEHSDYYNDLVDRRENTCTDRRAPLQSSLALLVAAL